MPARPAWGPGPTRAGNFSRSAEGQLVTAEGYQVMPGVTIPEGAISVTVGSDGTVSAQMPNQTDLTQIGQIQVASFPNPAGRQGMLEGSNVNVVEELVDMIETQRAYEVNSKMISATDEMLKYVNQNI